MGEVPDDDRYDDPRWDGWSGKALDLLVDRIDAIRADVNALMGRPPDAEPPPATEPRVGGIGIATWVAIVATIVVPIVLAIVYAGNAT